MVMVVTGGYGGYQVFRLCGMLGTLKINNYK